MIKLSNLSDGPGEDPYMQQARSAVDDTAAFDHYLEEMEKKIRFHSRMISSVKKPAPTKTSARLRKRKI